MPKLQIKLISPLSLGSGLGRAGSVDRELVHDPLTGIPYIPGKTLRGLLRHEYEQIFAIGAIEGIPAPDLVFGVTGQFEASPLRIGNAWPTRSTGDLTFWRQAAADGLISPHEVLGQFSEIRRQTRMSRETGAPTEDTLRSFRFLRSGEQFESDVESSDEGALAALAIAAAALRRMGGMRNRGYGEVRCEILNATAQALTDWQQGTIKQVARAEVVAKDPTPAGATDETPQLLRYRLRLLEPAVLPKSRQSNPNSVESSDVVPSTTVRGLLARQYLRKYSSGRQFAELFNVANARVIAGDATPVWTSASDSSATQRIPISVRALKSDTDKVVDLIEGRPTEPVSRLRGFFAAQGPCPCPRVNPAMHLQYHHQRAHDRRAQRALGGEKQDRDQYGLDEGENGALFVYSSLMAGQEFEGSIRCDASSAAIIRELIPDQSTVLLGRSKQTQYGGRALWTWLEADCPDEPDRVTEGESVTIDLVTPLVGVNNNGHPGPFFPIHEFGAGALIKEAFTRRDQAGGFLSHQSLPRQQMSCIAAGSTFVIKVGEGFDVQTALTKRYGLRTEEGFGEIAARRIDPFQFEPAGVTHRPKVGKPKESGTRELLVGIWKQRTRDYVRHNAWTDCEQSLTRIGSISRQLIHQFILVLDSGPAGITQLPELLGRIKDRGRKNLEGCRFGDQNLEELLKERCSDVRQTARTALAQLKQAQDAQWTSLLGKSPERTLIDDPDFAAELTRVYLREFLTCLSKQAKKREESN